MDDPITEHHKKCVKTFGLYSIPRATRSEKVKEAMERTPERTVVREDVSDRADAEIRSLSLADKIKLSRAHGGCLGTRSRRRTERTPICSGEL